MAQMNLFTKQKQIHRHTEQFCVCQGRWWRGVGWMGSLGVSRSKLLHLEWISNKVPHTEQGTVPDLLEETMMENNILKKE